ncbi:hypothetical protein CCP3SC15_1890002 [Gammaproteobacteria bacterium]
MAGLTSAVVTLKHHPPVVSKHCQGSGLYHGMTKVILRTIKQQSINYIP